MAARAIRIPASHAGALGRPKERGGGRYKAKKVVVDGITFDSKTEARRYGDLLVRQRAGEISDLSVHPSFTVTINFKKVCDYTADFRYREPANTGPFVIEDVKSKGTRMARDWPLRKRLVEAYHCITIKEVVI